MTAREIVSNTLPPLKSTDTIERALHWMHDFHLAHLPIVEQGKLIGVIAEEDILNYHNHTDTLGELRQSVPRPFVRDTDHIYDIVKAVVQKKLTAIPVIDKTEQFIGTISLESLLQYFAESGSLTETGSIVVLEIPRRDYSLSTVARITEGEGVHILSSYITSLPEASTIELTLKLDSSEIQHVVATYERFGYNIKAAFEESDYIESLQQRYDALMSYLDI
jgi:acetoin utilization protein AcuB